MISGEDRTAKEFVETCTLDRRWGTAMGRNNVQRIDLRAYAWDRTVKVDTLNTLTLEQWIAEFQRLKQLNREILGNKAKARAQFELVVRGRRVDFNDPGYQREAQAALEKLTG